MVWIDLARMDNTISPQAETAVQLAADEKKQQAMERTELHLEATCQKYSEPLQILNR